MNSLFVRSPKNPILSPLPENEWENQKLYNPGAVLDDGGYTHLFYRAMNSGESWRSSIGHAVFDGDTLVRRDTQPAIVPEGPSEQRGCEDPRVTKIGDTYYMAYGAYDGTDVRVHIATSTDLEKWHKHGHALPGFSFLEYGGVRWKKDHTPEQTRQKMIGMERSKAAALFPEKINGKYWMLFGEFRVWLASSDDGLKYEVPREPFLAPRHELAFEDAFVEMGPSPIKTDDGWLVLYHSIDHNQTYVLSGLLLDLHDPRKILKRTTVPLFWPEEQYELAGLVDVLPGGTKAYQKMSDDERQEFIAQAIKDKIMPHVVFCPGATVKEGKIHLYYGASDSVICTAQAPLAEVLAAFDE